jgi:hypothetical protein
VIDSGRRNAVLRNHSTCFPGVLGTVAKRSKRGDNRCVDKAPFSSQFAIAPGLTRGPFLPGAIVIVTLSNPREKFWGMILALAPEGLSLTGIELASFEDFAVMVKDGEPFTPAVVFFPMHRIERMELDLPDGSLPSLTQRFVAKTGLEPSELLASSGFAPADDSAGAPHSTRSPSDEESA